MDGPLGVFCQNLLIHEAELDLYASTTYFLDKVHVFLKATKIAAIFTIWVWFTRQEKI